MVYYNLTTRLGLKGELEDDGRRPLSQARISFRGMSCNCKGLTCNCCAGINVTTFNFDRSACTNFTYDPDDFAIKLAIMMNEKVVYTNSVSGEQLNNFRIFKENIRILSLILFNNNT